LCVPVIPALGRLWQKDLEFEASLGYIKQDPVSNLKVQNKQVWA
jgi:hypothetical protein